MTLWILSDGWVDASSEGPYTNTLQTSGGWKIFRFHNCYRKDDTYELSFNGQKVRNFNTIKEAKAYTTSQEGRIKMKTNLVIYHAHCADGVAAAWAAWLYLNDSAEYLPGYYGMDLPDVEGKDVYLVDFSFKRHQIHELAGKASSVTILDHHKSAIEDLQGVDLFRDNINLRHCTTEKSGCQITYDYFHNESRPALIDVVADRDLWRFKLPNTKAAMAWVMSHDLTIEVFDQLVREYDFFTARAVTTGEALLRAQEKNVKSCMKHLTFIQFDNFSHMPAVNAGGMFASELGNMIVEKYQVALVYQIEKTRIKISMRSCDEGPDVSVVSQRYGGGGHRNAAGFSLDLTSIEGRKFLERIRGSAADWV